MSLEHEPLPASTIAFIIPVRSDAERLDRCLASIQANSDPSRPSRIIVADNGSTDNSPVVARRYGARVLMLPDLRLGALRNAAASAATEDVIAFVDADHEIAPGWTAAAMCLLKDPQNGGVGAPYATPDNGNWVQRAYGLLRRHPVDTSRVDWLGSGNLAVRRSVFESVGGFDTSLETCEDVDLCRRLRAKGVRLLADPRLRSVHHGDPRTLRQVFLGELWRGRDNLKVSFRRPLSLSMITSAVIPAVNLAAISAFLAGPITVPGAAWLRPAGLAASLAIALLRTALMLGRRRRDARTSTARTLAVAAAYELGRAFAVLGRFGYKNRRTTAPGTAAVSRGGGSK